MYVEKRHKTLVEKLKTELCSVKFLNQEEECVEVENTRKAIDDEFVVGIRLECFEEHDEDKESEEDMENDEDTCSEEMIECGKESEHEKSEHEESEEIDECEHGDLFGRMLCG